MLLKFVLQSATVESVSVFALTGMPFDSLQCFDAVGWAAGRASGL